MKKLHGILLVLGLGFLIFLLWQTGIRQLWRELTVLGWGLAPMVLGEGLAELCHAMSWCYFFSGPHQSIPLPRLLRIHLAGYAINFLTPTATLGGEVAKVALLISDRKRSEAVAAVLLGKLSFGLGHLLFVSVGLVVILPVLNLSAALRLILLLAGGALAAGVAAFLLLQRRGELATFLRWLAMRRIFSKTLQQFVRPMDQVDEALKIFHRKRPWDFAQSVAWNFFAYAIGIFTTWYFLSLLENQPAFAAAARVWFLTLWIDLVTFALPLNLGVLEGGRLLAFRTFGFSALSGMTFGMVTRIAQLFWAGVGLLNYSLLTTRLVHKDSDLERKL